MQTNILIVFVIFALCLVNSANAIKCYYCKSLGDPNCAKDIMGNSTKINIVDCDRMPVPDSMEQYLPVTRCNKVITQDAGGPIVSRDCQFTPIGSKPDVCTVSHSRQVERCYTCTGDLCNASSTVRNMALGLAAIVALVSMHFVF